jgi:hypothetical protein
MNCDQKSLFESRKYNFEIILDSKVKFMSNVSKVNPVIIKVDQREDSSFNRTKLWTQMTELFNPLSKLSIKRIKSLFLINL